MSRTKVNDIPVPKRSDTDYWYEHYYSHSNNDVFFVLSSVHYWARYNTDLLNNVPISSVVLRVIEYQENTKAFCPHYDPNYFTLVLGSIGFDGSYKHSGKVHYGLHASDVLGYKPTLHTFNPRGSQYSFVVFYNLPSDYKLNSGETVGSQIDGLRSVTSL